MKTIVLILALLAIPFANAVEIGPFQGLMNNYTQFRSESFRIEARFQCYKVGVEFEYDRDTVSKKVEVKADGSFSIPKLELPHLELPSYLGCHLEIEYKLQENLAKSYSGYSSQRLSLTGPQLYKHEIVVQFTAIETLPQSIHYQSDLGLSSADFIATLGKNYIYRLEYDFSKILAPNQQAMAKHSFYRWGAVYKNSVGVTPFGILYVPGLHNAKDLNVDVNMHLSADYQNETKHSGSIEVLHGLPSEFLDLSVQPSKIDAMPLDGKWEATLIIDTRMPDNKVEKFYFFADAELQCQSGQLSGMIKMRTWMSPDKMPYNFPVAGEVPVTGTCDGKEKVEAQIGVRYRDGSTKNMRFSVDRIADCRTAPFCLSSQVSPGHYDNFDYYPAADFGESISLFSTENQMNVGTIRFQRDY